MIGTYDMLAARRHLRGRGWIYGWIYGWINGVDLLDVQDLRGRLDGQHRRHSRVDQPARPRLLQGVGGRGRRRRGRPSATPDADEEDGSRSKS